MVSFELGKEIERDVFRLVTSAPQRKKILSPHEESHRTSDSRMSGSNALPSSHRDTMVRVAH